MAAGNSGKILRRLLRSVSPADGSEVADGQLLERFITRADESAFATLVGRHGPMVWGVCRRVLRHHHDAEDAFQATFLVLIRKAASIAAPDLLANWLYGVARRTALKARALAAQRQAKERPFIDTAMPVQDANGPCLETLLDQELSALPAKYRAPLVLCDLEGKTRKEAARLLLCPEGTVAGRLARAKTMLAKRLARRGVGFSGGALALVLAEQVAAKAIPASLLASTIKAATVLAAGQVPAGLISAPVAALTKGVLRTMFLTKLKIAGAVLLTVGMIGLGAGSMYYPVPAAKGPEAALADEPKPGTDAGKAVPDRERLQGSWTLVFAEDGKSQYQEPAVGEFGKTFTFAGDKVQFTRKGKKQEATFTLDPARKPKEIDLQLTEAAKGIYLLDGNSLLVCFGSERPNDFTTKPRSAYPVLLVLRKAGIGESLKERVLSLSAAVVKTLIQAEKKKLQGTWVRESGGEQPVRPVPDGKDGRAPAQFLVLRKIVIADETFIFKYDQVEQPWKYQLDPLRKPKWMDITYRTPPSKKAAATLRAIYQVDGDILKIQYPDNTAGSRPAKLGIKAGAKQYLYTLKREKTD